MVTRRKTSSFIWALSLSIIRPTTTKHVDQCDTSPVQPDVTLVLKVLHFLSTLSSDAASQLDVLGHGHDGHSLGVDGAQIGFLEQTNQVNQVWKRRSVLKY